MERRLAAILAADFAGYSARVALDEDATVRAVRGHLEATELVIGLHRGRVVKTLGDGLLAEFSSSVDAVTCATAIQARIAERNADIPEDRRLHLRIGVHSGDILCDGGDIFGDGVNIASRIEGQAPPGGVAISQRVHEEVAGRIEQVFSDTGLHELKNIPAPLRLFAWSRAEPARTAPRPPRPLPNKPSLAVLPLTNLSGASETEYIADGLTEDIISALAHVPWLFVIARNSTFAFKGVPVDMRRIGQDLGVRYVVEGSLRQQGNRVRVTGRMADTETGLQVWSGRFDAASDDIFALQDEISEAVAAAVAPSVQMAEMARVERSAPGNPSAYDHYLHALAALNRAQVERAAAHLDAAIESSPSYGKAMAIRAWCHTLNVAWRVGYLLDDDRERGTALANAALEAAPQDLEVAAYAGYTLAFFGTDIDRGMHLVREACRGCPSFAWAWTSAAMLEMLQGDSSRVLDLTATAKRLNPRDPMWFRALVAICSVHRDRGEYELALEAAQEGLRLNPHVVMIYVHAICCLVALDRLEEAREMGRRLLAHSPDFSVAGLDKHHRFFRAALHARDNSAALRRAGLPG
ncbi:adenylate/guanylate cyclase domain-containing protein [Cribrihabitans sp. XS_ASV171]